MNTRPVTLLLLRHGESTANAADMFGGWRDYPLTARGRAEATLSGNLLRDADLVPSVVHTSLLHRATETADLVVEGCGAVDAPRRMTWRLNERHYGALQGRPRAELRQELGEHRYRLLRRSYDQTPPAIGPENPDHPIHDARYAALPPRELPGSESLADVRRRLVPYWQDAIAADLLAARVTLIVGHGNSLRALCMHLDGLTPDEVLELHIPTGVPLRYDLDQTLSPLIKGGRYLDGERAEAGIREVRTQGSD